MSWFILFLVLLYIYLNMIHVPIFVSRSFSTNGSSDGTNEMEFDITNCPFRVEIQNFPTDQKTIVLDFDSESCANNCTCSIGLSGFGVPLGRNPIRAVNVQTNKTKRPGVPIQYQVLFGSTVSVLLNDGKSVALGNSVPLSFCYYTWDYLITVFETMEISYQNSQPNSPDFVKIHFKGQRIEF